MDVVTRNICIEKLEFVFDKLKEDKEENEIMSNRDFEDI